jgi:hypothetical protein
MRWSRFDNESEQKTPLHGETGRNLPGELLRADPGAYYAVDIHSGNTGKIVSVYLRKSAGEQIEVVGIERASSTNDKIAAFRP